MAMGWRVTAFPPGVLAGRIALISRGTCNFEVKLNNAQAAGAVGALVYNNVDGRPGLSMAVNSATLPGRDDFDGGWHDVAAATRCAARDHDAISRSARSIPIRRTWKASRQRARTRLLG